MAAVLSGVETCPSGTDPQKRPAASSAPGSATAPDRQSPGRRRPWLARRTPRSAVRARPAAVGTESGGPTTRSRPPSGCRRSAVAHLYPQNEC